MVLKVYLKITESGTDYAITGKITKNLMRTFSSFWGEKYSFRHGGLLPFNFLREFPGKTGISGSFTLRNFGGAKLLITKVLLKIDLIIVPLIKS